LEDPSLYQQIVGSLQYLSFTRLNLSYTTNKLYQMMAKPTDLHFKALKCLLQYLKYSATDQLYYHKASPATLLAYSDADWASSKDDRRSTSGFVITFGSSPISWGTKKQTTVARSSTEAEYRAIATATTELVWLRSLLRELNIPILCPPVLYCDNIGATYMTVNPVFHARTKHVEIDFHFVRDEVASGRLHVRYLPSVNQVTDLLTKLASTDRLLRFKTKLQVLQPAA